MQQNRTVGIDASNIRAGGGLKHLRETLNAATDPREFGIERIHVYGGTQLAQLIDRPWLVKRQLPAFERGFLSQYWWKSRSYPGLLRAENQLVYVPGGLYPGAGVDYVCTAQNMLVFERRERNRFPLGPTRLRYSVLNRIQRRAFRHSIGNIFITEHSRALIQQQVPASKDRPYAIVPYGATADFFAPPKPQRPIDSYSFEAPLRALYVSVVNFYKHQWHLVDAVGRLRERGYPIHLTLIGPPGPGGADARLQAALARHPEAATYLGPVPYAALAQQYKDADLYLFGSSCETMPNVLVEAMSAGLPIVSSHLGPMREILGEGGGYADPTDPVAFAEETARLLDDPALRSRLARRAHDNAARYTWEKSAEGIYGFLGQTLTTRP